MDLTLTRFRTGEYGVFGTLEDETSSLTLKTLEHAYLDPVLLRYAPKVPAGVYTCRRGNHKTLHSDEFETFEVTGVDGHEGILFHIGNYNKDSDGCILVGEAVAQDMITSSAKAFSDFIRAQKGTDMFVLRIVDGY